MWGARCLTTLPASTACYTELALPFIFFSYHLTISSLVVRATQTSVNKTQKVIKEKVVKPLCDGEVLIVEVIQKHHMELSYIFNKALCHKPEDRWFDTQ
jgi:hypothetical protein